MEPTTEDRTNEPIDLDGSSSPLAPKVGVVLGALGVVAGVWMYWLVVPAVLLGVAAIVIGWRARRAGHRELGSVALALGVVAILLVPSVMAVADSAEDWGRDCALGSQDPNCP